MGIKLLGLVADSERNVMSATKPNSSIPKPAYNWLCDLPPSQYLLSEGQNMGTLNEYSADLAGFLDAAVWAKYGHKNEQF